MQVHTSIVEAAFDITRRGCVIAPGILREKEIRVRIGDPLTLRKPDGTLIRTHVAGLEFLTPPNPRCVPVLLPKEFKKSDVPIGSLVTITETHV